MLLFYFTSLERRINYEDTRKKLFFLIIKKKKFFSQQLYVISDK